MDALLKCDSLEIRYGERIAAENISFSLKQGEILGIVGESGSGKSTIMKSLIRLLGREGRVTGGMIHFRGQDLLTLQERQMRQIRGSQIGMIAQDAGASFCPIRTIGSQIFESMSAHERLSRSEARERAMELFARIGFSDGERIWNSYPFELSGGMNQRVGIAVSMLLHPVLLLADEPTSALDVSVQKQVVTELLHLRELFGMAVILVTHDLGVVSAMADRILVLKDGRAMEYGSAAQILTAPENSYTKQLLAAVPRLRR